MQHVIPTNDFCFGIGKQRKGVTEFLRLALIDLGWIDADGHKTHASGVEIGEPVLETP